MHPVSKFYSGSVICSTACVLSTNGNVRHVMRCLNLVSSFLQLVFLQPVPFSARCSVRRGCSDRHTVQTPRLLARRRPSA